MKKRFRKRMEQLGGWTPKSGEYMNIYIIPKLDYIYIYNMRAEEKTR